MLQIPIAQIIQTIDSVYFCIIVKVEREKKNYWGRSFFLFFFFFKNKYRKVCFAELLVNCWVLY